MVKNTRTSGFTLVEVLVSVMLTGMILTSAYSAFQGIMKSQIQLGGTIDIQRNLFYLNEKLSALIHNGGTIDYEEYFNRRILGYSQWLVTTSGQSHWTYSTVSNYGNGSGTGKQKILICGVNATTNTDACLANNAVGNQTPSGTLPTFNQQITGQQAYRQYREIAFDYSSYLPSPTKLPSIFPTNTPTTKMDTEWIPELYLIKKLPDGSYERVYFRHVFAQDPFPNIATCTNPTTQTKWCIGKVQMTKLRSCDILKSDNVTPGTDGVIDVWIPEANFSNAGTPLTCATVNNYSNATKDLAWVDISSPDMNITRALFLPTPVKIPGLMAGTGEIARSPTIQVRLEVQFSETLLRRGMMTQEANSPRILITTFDLPDM